MSLDPSGDPALEQCRERFFDIFCFCPHPMTATHQSCPCTCLLLNLHLNRRGEVLTDHSGDPALGQYRECLP